VETLKFRLLFDEVSCTESRLQARNVPAILASSLP
jgi:hypothetical protein